MPRLDALQISSVQTGPTLTPSHKRFNTLLRQIERARHKLAAWQENIAAYRRSYTEVLEPLQLELIAGLRQWVFALDAMLEQRSWTRAERGTLREMLCEAAGELLQEHDGDEALKALYNKHAEVDFETEQREQMRVMKGLAEAMTGLDLGEDDDIDDDAQLLRRLQQGLQEQAAGEQARASAKAARRPKSAAQQQRQTQAQQATQSVREVYRKLASALHPDRETDERQRQEKTALMQRANQAYEAGDLLALLELQLQIEQIDASHIANAGEQRLKHYNQVLGEQLGELKAELQYVEMDFCLEFSLEPECRLEPARLGEVLEHTRRQWQADLHVQQRELRMLHDVQATKRWLKRERQQQREAEFDLPF